MKNIINLVTDSIEIIGTPEGYAEAAIVATNPDITWVKFVFTDDQPNANNQRIPQTEFANVKESGIYMPIKMQENQLDGEHSLSTPVGTITNLVQQDNKILGLAALWKREREQGVAAVQQAIEEGKQPTLSWEMYFDRSEVDADGVENLIGTTVRGITFVKTPAYQGRTNVIAVAETTEETSDKDKEATLGNENTVETQNPAPETQEVQEDVTAKLVELEQLLEEKTETIEQLTQEKDQLATENEELASWKSGREAEDNRAELIRTRRGALVEAGVSLSDDEWTDREERVLKMDEETFGFYAQELAAFASKITNETNESTAEAQNPNIPNVFGSAGGSKSDEDILRAMIRNQGA